MSSCNLWMEQTLETEDDQPVPEGAEGLVLLLAVYPVVPAVPKSV